MNTINLELLGELKKNKKNKFKKANIIKLYKYLFLKIFTSFSSIFIIILTLLFSLIFPIILFLISSDIYNTIKNLQFYILFFYSVFLFLFILLITVKLFGNQIDDNSFLLILTKPYSRKTIILIQYLVIYFSTLLLIIFSIIEFLIIGNILIEAKNKLLKNFYNIMSIKFLFFNIFFSFLLINSIVFLLGILNSRVVFLIFSIFCSLFILGGLPYSLIENKNNNIILSFSGKKNKDIRLDEIIKSLMFKKFLYENKIKYKNITKSIFELFYTKFNFDEILNFNSDDNKKNRLNFYENMKIINKEDKVLEINGMGKIETWFDKLDLSSTTGANIKIIQKKSFINIKELENSIKNNKNNKVILNFQKDLLNIIKDYKKKYGENLINFMKNLSNKTNQLLQFETSKNTKNIIDYKPNNVSYINFKDKHKKDKFILLEENEIIQAFNNPMNYKIDNNSRTKYDNFFYNPIFFIIRSLEDSIMSIVNTLDYIKYETVKTDSINNIINQYKKYKNIIKKYFLINKLNVFEHFNQLWTFTLDYYGDYYFNPYLIGVIDFNNEINPLFSYPMLFIDLNKDNKIIYEIKKISNIQNNILVFYSYLILSFIFYFLSLIIWKYKKIS